MLTYTMFMISKMDLDDNEEGNERETSEGNGDATNKPMEV